MWCEDPRRTLAQHEFRMDYAYGYGQQVLEEDYDENYEPTEEGTLTCRNSNSLARNARCHGHVSVGFQA